MIITIVIGGIADGHGTDRAVVNLANSLCEYGSDCKVQIVSCCTPEGTKSYFPLHESVQIFNLGLNLKNKFNYIKLVKELTKICKETKADFILGTTHALNSILVKVNAKGLKKIGCEHMNYGAAPFYSKFVRRLAYPKLDAVVLLTEADRAHYGFCKNTYVIPNCVIVHKEASTCENKIMLAVGRYTYQKGFDMLIDAFALAHSKSLEWKLRIVGGGEEKELLKKKIAEHKLENFVTLVPFTKNIQAEYLEAGMYLLSSRFEGFVLVLVEAKDAGLPTIAYDCPEGPADIVCDGKDGFLVKPNDVSAFAERMVQLANDEKLRKQFGSYGKEDIKRISPENVFNMWDKLFKKLESKKIIRKTSIPTDYRKI